MGLPGRRFLVSVPPASPARLSRAFTMLAGLLMLAAAAPARAWLYDQNHNRIDDRIEAVHTQGLAAAYENGDVTKRMLIGVAAGPPVTFRVYVGYDHHPTNLHAHAGHTLVAS